MFGIYCGANNVLYPTGSVFCNTNHGQPKQLDFIIKNDHWLCNEIRATPLAAVHQDMKALALVISHRICDYTSEMHLVQNRYLLEAHRPLLAMLPVDIWCAICDCLKVDDLYSLLKAAPYNNVRSAVYYRSAVCIQTINYVDGPLEDRSFALPIDARCYWHELYIYLAHGTKSIPWSWLKHFNRTIGWKFFTRSLCQLTHPFLEWTKPVPAVSVARVLLHIIDSGAQLRDFLVGRWIPG